MYDQRGMSIRPSSRRPAASSSIRRSSRTGAAAQHGRRLAAHAAALIPRTDEPYFVVEIGPGTGAVTDAIQARLPRNGTLIAVERCPLMVEHLHRTRPWLDVIPGDAADLPEILRRYGLSQPNLIISGLPWSLWNAEQQTRTLVALTGSLLPDGVLGAALDACPRPAPADVRFRRQLHQRFQHVRGERLIWLSAPPARWYVAAHPLLDV